MEESYYNNPVTDARRMFPELDNIALLARVTPRKLASHLRVKETPTTFYPIPVFDWLFRMVFSYNTTTGEILKGPSFSYDTAASSIGSGVEREVTVPSNMRIWVIDVGGTRNVCYADVFVPPRTGIVSVYSNPERVNLGHYPAYRGYAQNYRRVEPHEGNISIGENDTWYWFCKCGEKRYGYRTSHGATLALRTHQRKGTGYGVDFRFKDPFDPHEQNPACMECLTSRCNRLIDYATCCICSDISGEECCDNCK